MTRLLWLGSILVALTVTGDRQASEKPTFQGSHVRQVCYEHVAVHLGDSYDTVAAKVDLRPDPNGLNANPNWVAGKATDFVWIGSDYALPDGGTLRPTVFLTFTDRRVLDEVTVSWYLDGDRSPARIAAIVDIVQDRLHPCLKGGLDRTSEWEYGRRVDYGTYSETLTVGVKTDSKWRIEYRIATEP